MKNEKRQNENEQQKETIITIDGLTAEQEDYLLESWREQELEARFIK